MSVNDKKPEWMKVFFPYNPWSGSGHNPVAAAGQDFLRQTLDLQRASFSFYRQMLEGQDSVRSMGEYQGEVVRNLMEALGPVHAAERTVRRQVVKLQSAVLDVCEDTLRVSARYGTEKRGASES